MCKGLAECLVSVKPQASNQTVCISFAPPCRNKNLRKMSHDRDPTRCKASLPPVVTLLCIVGLNTPAMNVCEQKRAFPKIKRTALCDVTKATKRTSKWRTCSFLEILCLIFLCEAFPLESTMKSQDLLNVFAARTFKSR